MITTKLRKNANTKQLLIQFSDRKPHLTLQKFYFNCKEEGVLTKKQCLRQNQLNFYHVQNEETVQMGTIKLNPTASKLAFVLSILYVSSQQQQKAISKIEPIKRTLILREALQLKFYHDYQFQNTQSQQESLIYLCQLSSSIINSRLQKNRGFYGQKTQQIKNFNLEQSSASKLWINIFFQIPGLGKQKCLAITSKFPTYQSLLKDYEGSKELKNIMVSRGAKQIKLGLALANRIYKCLFSLNGNQSIYQV